MEDTEPQKIDHIIPTPVEPPIHKYVEHAHTLICVSCANRHTQYLPEKQKGVYNNIRSDTSGSSVA